MINRRPYIAEVAIKPGIAVMQGSADNKVKICGPIEYSDFIGIYSFEANEEKKTNEPIGIVIGGVAKALAGAAVSAGKKATVKSDGSLIPVPSVSGPHNVIGTFLESGSAGDYVDVLVAPGMYKYMDP